MKNGLIIIINLFLIYSNQSVQAKIPTFSEKNIEKIVSDCKKKIEKADPHLIDFKDTEKSYSKTLKDYFNFYSQVNYCTRDQIAAFLPSEINKSEAKKSMEKFYLDYFALQKIIFMENKIHCSTPCGWGEAVKIPLTNLEFWNFFSTTDLKSPRNSVSKEKIIARSRDIFDSDTQIEFSEQYEQTITSLSNLCSILKTECDSKSLMIVFDQSILLLFDHIEEYF